MSSIRARRRCLWETVPLPGRWRRSDLLQIPRRSPVGWLIGECCDLQQAAHLRLGEEGGLLVGAWDVGKNGLNLRAGAVAMPRGLRMLSPLPLLHTWRRRRALSCRYRWSPAP